MRFVVFCAAFFLSFLILGCQEGSQDRPAVERVFELEQRSRHLSEKLNECRDENERLREQVDTLSGLSAELKTKDLVTVQTVKLHRFTNLYDRDEDGKKEKLIVYIRPMDEQGDIIKAGGCVEVQLWNLEGKAQEALIGEWEVGSDELKDLWFNTMVTNYRLSFDVGDKVESFDEPLTVKVVFTDYLTGRIFKEQIVIKP